MEPLDYYKKAWDVVAKDLVGWFIFNLVWVFTIPICGLGLLLMANVTRESKAAIAEGRAPSIGALFSFSTIGRDIVAIIIFAVAMSLGSGVSFGLLSIVFLLLFQFLFPILADDRYEPVDCAKLSAKFFLADWQKPTIFGAIGLGVSIAGSMFFITSPLAMAIREVATRLYYEDNRGAVDAIAASEGIQRLGGPVG